MSDGKLKPGHFILNTFRSAGFAWKAEYTRHNLDRDGADMEASVRSRAPGVAVQVLATDSPYGELWSGGVKVASGDGYDAIQLPHPSTGAAAGESRKRLTVARSRTTTPTKRKTR
jgi:hypothetical protein